MELFPEIDAYNTGFLKVSDIHSLYYDQSGNPQGKPVIYLHGGPGGGCSASDRRYFDPKVYRIILLDQRGKYKLNPWKIFFILNNTQEVASQPQLPSSRIMILGL